MLSKAFTKQVCADARAHAESEWPREACGVVVDGKYEPCANIAQHPAMEFRIENKILLYAVQRGLQAVVHSHIGVGVPSRYDLVQQRQLQVPWGIIGMNGAGAAGDILIFEVVE